MYVAYKNFEIKMIIHASGHCHELIKRVGYRSG